MMGEGVSSTSAVRPMMTIEERRILKGWNQQYFAHLLNVSQPHLSKIESGKQRPSADLRARMARLLECTIQDLVDNEQTDLVSSDVYGSPAKKGGELTGSEECNRSLCRHLSRLGVSRRSPFGEVGFRNTLAIDDIIELWCFPGAGRTGLRPHGIVTEQDSNKPELPPYVWTALTARPVPEWNNPLAFVTGCRPPISDVGGTLNLRLANRDWHLKESIQDCRSMLCTDISHRKINVADFPGFLSVGITVESKRDRQLILPRRTQYLSDEPREWCLGVGENMHAEKDWKAPWGLHPHHTVLRGLREELGLQEEELSTADVRYLALGLSIENFSVNLFAHAVIDRTSDELREIAYARAEDREWDSLEAVPSNIENCLDLVISGNRRIDAGSSKQLPIASWARLGGLYFALARFGPLAVLSALEACKS